MFWLIDQAKELSVINITLASHFTMKKHCEKRQYYCNYSLRQLQLGLLRNGNWTEWSTIQGVIGQVILNRPSA